jgi:hypothetical protein
LLSDLFKGQIGQLLSFLLFRLFALTEIHLTCFVFTIPRTLSPNGAAVSYCVIDR